MPLFHPHPAGPRYSRIRYTIALGALLGGPAAAAGLEVKVEIPRMTVAEYHRPYVAMWVEDGSQKFVANLAVWYDLKQKDNEGTKWLKDLRQWWRKSPLGKLPSGDYHLVVEAAREVGGRELLRLPFQWPPQAPRAVQAKGQRELGAIALAVKP